MPDTTATPPRDTSSPLVQSFRIEFTPQPRHDDPAVLEGLTAGRIALSCDGEYLTSFSPRYEEYRTEDNQRYLSAYPLAEWLAANWYRLRWETLPSGPDPSLDWHQSHRMGEIGHGYVWPDICIQAGPDRQTVGISSSPTMDRVAPIHYHGAPRTYAVPSHLWEEQAKQFINQTIDLLNRQGHANTELHQLWTEVQADRQDPEADRFRKAEAVMGYDPDAADPDAVNNCLAAHPNL